MPMTLNPSIKILILKYNKFHSVDASFNFYPELELVDLSSNELVSIPDRSFSSQRRLVELRMDSNHISELSERTWSGLSRLQVLSLGHNLLDKLANRVFRPAKHLKELNLGQNRISEIEDDAFEGLSELTVLDLSDNQLETVPSEALRHLTNLAELRLGQNNLRVIPDSSFSSLIKLSSLDVSGNKIERVHQKAFSGLKDLQSLNLRDNELYQVPSHAFHHFNKLQSLDIGQNKFSAIDQDSFQPLSKLQSLTISGCSHLVEITAMAFSGLDHLHSLVISNNKQLRFIHHEAFGQDSPVDLKTLDVSNNRLSSLSSSMISWSSLTSLDMSANVWDCDCSLAFLKSVIINTVNVSSSHVRLVRCASPPSLRNKDITKITIHNCDQVSSPKTDKSTGVASSGAMNNTELIAIITASAVVISVVLIVLVIKSRKRLFACISSKSSSKPPVAQGKILQYSPYQQEPRYVSYQVVQTLHRPSTATSTLIVNPQSESLVRQENYFLTLKDHEKLHYLADLESAQLTLDYGQPPQHYQQQGIIPSNHTGRLPSKYRLHNDESIYQRVDTDDPVSDI